VSANDAEAQANGAEGLGEFKEADFKIIAIDETDRWAADVHDINDLESLRPGTLDRIR
jgi:inorganic pyrophosphatase